MKLKEGSLSFLSAMRFQTTRTTTGGSKRWKYGAFAFLLTLTTLFLNSFILTEYIALEPLFAPIMIVSVLGLWGLVLGFIVMKPVLNKFMVGIALFVSIGLISLVVISIFSGILSSASGFSLLGVPSWVAMLLYGGIGVMETSFFQGIQATIRTYWARTNLSLALLFLFMFIGGIAFHSAIGRRIYHGSIFDAPGYIFFVGISWVIFAGLLEFTDWIDVPIVTHWFWNVGITAFQEGVI